MEDEIQVLNQIPPDGDDTDNEDTGNAGQDKQNSSATATGTEGELANTGNAGTQNENVAENADTNNPDKMSEDFLKNFMLKMQDDYVTLSEMPLDENTKHRMQIHKNCYDNMMDYFYTRSIPTAKFHSVAIRMEDDGT